MIKLHVNNSVDRDMPAIYIRISAITAITEDSDGDTAVYVGETFHCVEEDIPTVLETLAKHGLQVLA